MRIRFRHILLFFVMCLMLSGCAGNSRQKEISEISQKYGVSSDRQLVVYTSHKEEVYLPIIREFENRTGIWVEVRAGGTNELLSEIKKSADPGRDALKNFSVLEGLPDKVGEGAVICLSSQNYPLDRNVRVVPIGMI